jgi:hypothetical protein
MRYTIDAMANKATRRRHFYIWALAIILTGRTSLATTVVVVVTPDAIFVGEDSRANAHTAAGRELRPNVKKAFIIENRLVLAGIGLAAFNISSDKDKLLFSYDFAKWVADIEKKCPKDVTVSALTKLVEAQSRITFDGFSQYMKAKAFQSNYPPDRLFEYVMVGYDAGIPTVNDIYYEVDRKNWNLIGPKFDPEYPRADSGANGVLVFGRNDVAGLSDTTSDTYKEILTVIPNELPKVLSHKELSHPEAAKVCLAILRFEAKYYRDMVGPPYIIMSIPRVAWGGVIETPYSK